MVINYIYLALIGVGVVLLLLTVNPLTALYIMVSVGMVDLFLFGEMWIAGLRFNQVSANALVTLLIS